jgi:putative flavoprotein involved in K+ transport
MMIGDAQNPGQAGALASHVAGPPRRAAPERVRADRGAQAVGAQPERTGTLVIGAGQAGLSVGYHLRRLGLRFLILDARQRVGDAWRERWDSLRLFTPARFDSLDGMPFPAPANAFPTKDEMADYLEAYAARFELPVLTGMRVDGLSRVDAPSRNDGPARGDGPSGRDRRSNQDARFLATAGGRRFEADNVVVAMVDYQKPWIPDFAEHLDPGITQLHSFDYRNPAQLQPGPVLLVGAGNSGSEIAMELAPRHTVWMSGRDTGHIPFRIGGFAGRTLLVRLVLRGLFHRVLTVRTPIGWRVRPKVLHKGGPLIRVKPAGLTRAGVRRVPRTAGVKDGLPLLDDGRILNVHNVIWCTGFRPGFDWIDLPVFRDGDPVHHSGIVDSEPGLYFVGLHFLHSLSSGMVHGVGRDAERVARHVAGRMSATGPGAMRGTAPTEVEVAVAH